MYNAHDCQPLFLTEASRPLQLGDITPDWHEEWIRVIRLAVTLTLVVLLMVVSIYLVAARTTLPSIPETQRSGYNGRAYAQIAPQMVPPEMTLGSVSEPVFFTSAG